MSPKPTRRPPIQPCFRSRHPTGEKAALEVRERALHAALQASTMRCWARLTAKLRARPEPAAVARRRTSAAARGCRIPPGWLESVVRESKAKTDGSDISPPAWKTVRKSPSPPPPPPLLSPQTLATRLSAGQVATRAGIAQSVPPSARSKSIRSSTGQ
jgi:hypothetical protein